jgi:hypothetical protein
MKKLLISFSLLFFVLLFGSAAPAEAASPTFTLLTPLPTTLAVGES